MFLHSIHMYKLAKIARQRCEEGSTEDAIVAVVLAAASLEGFLNELVGLLRFAPPETPATVLNLVEIWEDLEDTKVGTKFPLAARLLGKALERDKLPYQDFILLFQLRNQLVHLKPRVVIGVDENGKVTIPEPPKILESLRSRGLIRRIEHKGLIVSWYNEIMTPSVAAWACNVVVDIAKHFIQAIPSGPTKDLIESVFSDFIAPPGIIVGGVKPGPPG